MSRHVVPALISPINDDEGTADKDERLASAGIHAANSTALTNAGLATNEYDELACRELATSVYDESSG